MRIGLDLDGTLLECRSRQVGLMAMLAKACGLAIHGDDYWRLKREGASNRVALGRLAPDAQVIETVCALWGDAIEDSAWLQFDRPHAGVRDLLQAWRDDGHTLHLVSARRNRATAEQQLHVLGMDGFSTVEFVDPARADAKCAALGNLRPAVYIGDTERDGHCARAAGTIPALVASGLRSRAYLENAGPWAVVDRIDQVALPGTGASTNGNRT